MGPKKLNPATSAMASCSFSDHGQQVEDKKGLSKYTAREKSDQSRLPAQHSNYSKGKGEAKAKYSTSRVKHNDKKHGSKLSSYQNSSKSPKPHCSGQSERGKYNERHTYRNDPLGQNMTSCSTFSKKLKQSERPSHLANNKWNGKGRYKSSKKWYKSSKHEVSHGEETEEQAHDGSNCDIPGFYYDAEKKKYFRILPGQNCNAKVVTRETIKQQKSEEIRKQKIKELLFPLKSSVKVNTNVTSVPLKRNRCSISCNIYDKLDGIRSGILQNNHPSVIEHVHSKHIAASLRPRGSVKVFDNPFHMYEKLEHFTRMIPSPDYKKFLCLWSLKGVVVQRIQSLGLNSLTRCDEDGSIRLDIEPSGRVLLQHHSRVTNVCWAPPGDDGVNEDCSILFTTTCFMGTNASLALLRKMDGDSTEEQADAFNLGHLTTWTCAWNAYGQQFSVGAEGCSLLLDVNTRRLWELSTQGSNVQAQAFSVQGGQMLFSGTKKGHIFGHDLRSNSTMCTLCLSHKTSISHVLPTPDGYGLLASDFSGKLVQWDLRKRKVVMSFKGNYNEYTCIPFYLDPSHTIIYGVGQDCYTRLWDFKTGELVHTIPPPYAAFRNTIPAVSYAPNLGSLTTPGLLMGMHDQLHFYSI